MDIAIVGGGIGGLATAVALNKIGISTTIYESTSSFKPLGAGIGIGSNAMLALQQMEVGESILAHGLPLHEQRFYNGKGKLMNTIDFTRLKKQFGEETITIQRADLHEALFEAVPSASFHFNKRVEHFTQNKDRVTLTFTDGTVATHEFVIAADGIHSLFRQQLVPNSSPRYAGYTCWRGISQNDGDVPLHVSSEAWSTDGRFGWAPLHNGEVYWFACVNAREGDAFYANLSPREVAAQFKHFGPTVERLIQETKDDYFLHHDLYDIAPLSTFHYGRILLLGDAAHATTPNMGQGAGQSIEDAYELMLAFEREDTWELIAERYDAYRVPKTKKVIDISRQIGWAAQWDQRWLVTLRDTIFPYVPKSLLFQRLTFLFK